MKALTQASAIVSSVARRDKRNVESRTRSFIFQLICGAMERKIETSVAALRAFAILETVARCDQPVSMTEVTAAVQLPKPTVYRLLALLEAARLVQREPASKRYSAGPRAVRFALDVSMSSATRGARHAILQRLVDEVGETCNFTVLDGAEVVYLDRVETARP